MPENTNQPKISWHVSEHYTHERTKRWYAAAMLILAILLAYAILTANFLFAIILIVASITMILRDKQETAQLAVAIDDDGMHIGKEHFLYAKLKNFWIYYEPDENAKTLFLEFKNIARPRLAIPLVNQNPLRIRAILLQYLPENLVQEHEPLSEQLTRYFKL